MSRLASPHQPCTPCLSRSLSLSLPLLERKAEGGSHVRSVARLASLATRATLSPSFPSHHRSLPRSLAPSFPSPSFSLTGSLSLSFCFPSLSSRSDERKRERSCRQAASKQAHRHSERDRQRERGREADMIARVQGCCCLRGERERVTRSPPGSSSPCRETHAARPAACSVVRASV